MKIRNSGMEIFKGKTLLLLGSNVASSDIVQYVNAQGGRTIVTDFYPREKSKAKQFATEALMLSTADIPALKQVVEEKNVNAVLAGVSEFNILKAQELSTECQLPFYCTREQWNAIEHKGQFRAKCIEHGVPCPRTYFTGSQPDAHALQTIEYPVIVKPVDASASTGITICHNEGELMPAIRIACEASGSGCIIIEQFFTGDEFTATYTVVDHQIALSVVDNRYPVTLNEGATSIPLFRSYPSTFTEEYEKQVDVPMKQLIASLGMVTGTYFVQGLYNREKNTFCMFEAGLRCAGEAPYRILEAVNGVNYLHNIVEYSLNGTVTQYDIQKEAPDLHGKKCGVLSYVSPGGIVSRIEGYDSIVKTLPSIIDSECRYKVGDTIPSGNTLRQIVLRFVLICDSLEELANTINRINEGISVLDANGTELCVKFDSSRLYTEFV